MTRAEYDALFPAASMTAALADPDHTYPMFQVIEEDDNGRGFVLPDGVGAPLSADVATKVVNVVVATMPNMSPVVVLATLPRGCALAETTGADSRRRSSAKLRGDPRPSPVHIRLRLRHMTAHRRGDPRPHADGWLDTDRSA